MWVIQAWVLYALIGVIFIELFILFFIFKLYKKMPLSEQVPTFPAEQSNEVLAGKIDALQAKDASFEAKDLAVDADIQALKANDVADAQNEAIQDAHIKNLEDHEGAIPAVEVPVVPVTEPTAAVEPTATTEG